MPLPWILLLVACEQPIAEQEAPPAGASDNRVPHAPAPTAPPEPELPSLRATPRAAHDDAGPAQGGGGPMPDGVGAAPLGEGQEAIGAVVRRSSGRVQACVERALVASPALSGRVSVGWTIVDGRVVEAHVVENATNDAALAACVVSAVRTFRFEPGTNAQVAEFPWVISGTAR